MHTGFLMVTKPTPEPAMDADRTSCARACVFLSRQSANAALQRDLALPTCIQRYIFPQVWDSNEPGGFYELVFDEVRRFSVRRKGAGAVWCTTV